MVARRLELEVGRNNIFFDRWTMQPGDSIIGTSNMVKKEWQSALMKLINENLRFDVI